MGFNRGNNGYPMKQYTRLKESFHKCKGRLTMLHFPRVQRGKEKRAAHIPFPLTVFNFRVKEARGVQLFPSKNFNHVEA